MAEQIDPQRGARILVILAALVIISGSIHQAQSVLVWFLLAIFLAAIGTPSVFWLEQKRIPHIVAVLFVVLGMAALLVVIGGLVGTSLKNFYVNLPYYQTRLQTHISSLESFFSTRGIPFPDSFLLDQLKPEAAKGLIASILKQLGPALFEIVLILLAVAFILLEASSFPIKLRAILGDPQRDFHRFMRFVYDINRYMVIKTAISLVVGILIGIWLSILGVDFPILWGFLAFLLHFVPNIGALIAAVPAVFLALIQFGIGRAALAAMGYLAVDFIFGYVVEPMLMGRRLGLSTLVAFLSLIFWGGLLGLIGVVLSIPLTMTLKYACENHKNTRWIAILLGPETSPAEVPPPSKKRIDSVT